MLLCGDEHPLPTPSSLTSTHRTHTRAAAAAAAEDAANAQAVATPNPLAAARKISASKHLLVRNDSFTEMRHQQQATMAGELATEAPATPVLAAEGDADAAAAAEATPPAVAPVMGKEGMKEEEVDGAGTIPAAAS